MSRHSPTFLKKSTSRSNSPVAAQPVLVDETPIQATPQYSMSSLGSQLLLDDIVAFQNVAAGTFSSPGQSMSSDGSPTIVARSDSQSANNGRSHSPPSPMRSPQTVKNKGSRPTSGTPTSPLLEAVLTKTSPVAVANRKRGTVSLSDRRDSVASQKRQSWMSGFNRQNRVHVDSFSSSKPPMPIFLLAKGKQNELPPSALAIANNDKGGLDQMLALLTLDDDHVRDLAFRVLSGLEIQATGAYLPDKKIADIKKMLKIDQPLVQEPTLNALASLSFNSELHVKIVLEISTEILIYFLLMKDAIRMSTAAATIIGNCAIHPGNRKILLDDGCLSHICTFTCKTSQEFPKAELAAANALAQLSIDGYEYGGIRSDVLRLLVEWLNREHNVALLQSTAACVANISNTDDKTIKEQLVQLDVLKALARLLKHSKDSTVLNGVVVAIANLTTKSRYQDVFLQNPKVVEYLCRLGRKTEDDEIRLGVVMTINNLANKAHSLLQQQGAVSLLNNYLDSGDADIQREANEALAVLASDEMQFYSNKPVSFLRTGVGLGVKAATDDEIKSLLNQLNSLEDAQIAAQRLKHLSLRAENSYKILQHNGLAFLFNALSTSTSDDLTLNALQTTKQLILKDSTQHQLRDTGFLNWIFFKLKAPCAEANADGSMPSYSSSPTSSGSASQRSSELFGSTVSISVLTATFELLTYITMNNVKIQLECKFLIPLIMKRFKEFDPNQLIPGDARPVSSHFQPINPDARASEDLEDQMSLFNGLQEQMLRALGSICSGNRKLQFQMRKHGVLKQVVEIIGNPRHYSEGTLKRALHCVAIFCERDYNNQVKARKYGAIGAIDFLFCLQTSSDAIKASCCFSGSELCKSNVKNQLAFYKQHFLSSLMELLKESSNQLLIGSAASFLVDLVKGNEKGLEELQTKSNLALISSVLSKSTNQHVLMSLLTVLILFTSKKQGRQSIRDSGLVSTLVCLLPHEAEQIRLASQKVIDIMENEK